MFSSALTGTQPSINTFEVPLQRQSAKHHPTRKFHTSPKNKNHPQAVEGTCGWFHCRVAPMFSGCAASTQQGWILPRVSLFVKANSSGILYINWLPTVRKEDFYIRFICYR